MKKSICSFLTVTFTLLLFAASGQAFRGGGGGGGGGFGWGWGSLLGLGLGIGIAEMSRPYPGYYYPTPVVVEQAPTVYMQQSPAAFAPAHQEPTYWYYCQESQSYYPYVKQCPNGWMTVVPSPPAPVPIK